MSSTIQIGVQSYPHKLVIGNEVDVDPRYILSDDIQTHTGHLRVAGLKLGLYRQTKFGQITIH